jgi:hypothetical protein
MMNLILPVPPDNKHDQNMPNSLENRERRVLVGSRSVLEVGSTCQFHDRTGRFWQSQMMRKVKTGTLWRLGCEFIRGELSFHGFLLPIDHFGEIMEQRTLTTFILNAFSIFPLAIRHFGETME